MALILTLVALAQLIVETALQRLIRGRVNWRPAALAVGAVFLGVGMAATFWLPVLLESDSVHLDNLTAVVSLDYRNFFVPLEDLLAAAPLHDAGAANGLRILTTMGIAQWALALSGLVTTALFYLRGARSQHPRALAGAAFFALMACLLIALTVPNSLGVWNRLPLLHVLQFPWRLLGPIAACLAIVGGANGLWLERLGARLRTGAIALLLALPIATSSSLFYMPEGWRVNEVDTSLAAWHEVKAPELLHTTATGEFLPRDVHVVPGPTEGLLADYADGYPVDKLNHDGLPPGSTARLVHNSPQALEWQIDASRDFIAEVYSFYWAGWRAEIDGQAAAIRPSEHHGLITFALPAGNHRVRVFLGSTPARDLAAWISLLSLLLVAAGAIALRRRRPATILAQKRRTSPGEVTGMLSGGALALLAVLLFFREGSAWLHSSPGEALPAQVWREFTLDGRIQLLGHDLNARVLRAGERLMLQLYWYALEESDVNFSSFVHLSTGGLPHVQSDKLQPGDRASSTWSPAGYILDNYAL